MKKKCPKCEYQWSDDISSTMFNLRKVNNVKTTMILTLILSCGQVDFFWINRDQKSFEWFVKLLSQLEIEQAEHGGAMSRWTNWKISPYISIYLFLHSIYP